MGQQSFVLFYIDLGEVINVTNVRAQTDSTASAVRSRTLVFMGDIAKVYHDAYDMISYIICIPLCMFA